MLFQRIVSGRAALARVVFEDGEGEPADAGSSVTVSITRDDGTVIDAARSATPVVGEQGAYTVPLSAAETATLDLLTLEWSGTVNSVATTERQVVEVCGGRYFTLTQLRKLRGLGDASEFADSDLDWGRTGAEDAVERACNVAFVPRYARDTFDGNFSPRLWLGRRCVRRVRSISIAGEALSADDFDDLVLERNLGVLESASGRLFPRGRQNVEVVFEHGWQIPPGFVARGSMKLARQLVFQSQVDDRVLRTRDDAGHETFYSAPGANGIVFSIPELEGAVNLYHHDDPII